MSTSLPLNQFADAAAAQFRGLLRYGFLFRGPFYRVPLNLSCCVVKAYEVGGKAVEEEAASGSGVSELG